MQDKSKRILKTAPPQSRYFTVFFIGLVQSSSFYCEIKDFFKCMLDFEKYKSLRKKLHFCTFGKFIQKAGVLICKRC